MIARDPSGAELRKEGDIMHIGYIIAIIFFVVWLIFKLIEATKARNKDIKDNDRSEDR